MGFQAQRAEALETLLEYLTEKGEVLDANTYRRQDDRPYSLRRIRTLFRTYPRMLQQLRYKYPNLEEIVHTPKVTDAAEAMKQQLQAKASQEETESKE